MGNNNNSYGVRGGGFGSNNRHDGGGHRPGGGFRSDRNGYSHDARPQEQPDTVAPLEEAKYVDKAESAVKALLRNDDGEFLLSTSKIRNILAMTSEILNKVNSGRGKDPQDAMRWIKSDLNYLRIRLVYECGREASVKDLERKAHLLFHLSSIKTIDQCELFCHYVEALVAYHRFQGGQD